MRPRKKILLHGATPATASILRVVLRLHYAVAFAASEAEMFDLSPAPDVFLLLDLSDDAYEAMERRLWRTYWRPGVVRATNYAATHAMEQLRSTLRVATFRKRGPKRDSVRGSRTASGAGADAERAPEFSNRFHSGEASPNQQPRENHHHG